MKPLCRNPNTLLTSFFSFVTQIHFLLPFVFPFGYPVTHWRYLQVLPSQNWSHPESKTSIFYPYCVWDDPRHSDVFDRTDLTGLVCHPRVIYTERPEDQTYRFPGREPGKAHLRSVRRVRCVGLDRREGPWMRKRRETIELLTVG